MTAQHSFKIIAFAAFGFAFSDWIGFLILMISAGFAGTLLGKVVLNGMTDFGFKSALNVVLVVISLRLIYTGFSGLWS